MSSWIIIALILGLVEGITEFVPVSSTGHLILVGNLLGFTGERAATFEVFIQLGAILAVVVAYRDRFLGLLDFKNRAGGFRGFQGIQMLFLTTLPAVILGLIAHKAIKSYLFYPFNVAVGLAVGGLWILLMERFRAPPTRRGLDAICWKDALAIGCFQCMALWPGMSRSSSTILGGMITGLDRKTATEYSFIAAVPLMFAACFYDLYKSASQLNVSDIPLFALGFIVAFISAFFAVRLLIRFLAHHTLVPFGWYRIALAALVFWIIH